MFANTNIGADAAHIPPYYTAAVLVAHTHVSVYIYYTGLSLAGWIPSENDCISHRARARPLHSTRRSRPAVLCVCVVLCRIFNGSTRLVRAVLALCVFDMRRSGLCGACKLISFDGNGREEARKR